MKKTYMTGFAGVVLAGLVILVTGCDLSVTNPGPIADVALNTPSAMPALVVGMSADLSVAVTQTAEAVALMSGEMVEAGNYADQQYWYAGTFGPDEVITQWDDMQQARWVAEHGILRMQKVMGSDFDTDALAPQAYLWAGYSNRLLGENVCQAVIDGGPALSDSVYFQRADSDFTQALTYAQTQGDTTLMNAALAGRASVLLSLGDWSGAVADAQQVPADFVYDAIFSTNTARENNDLAYNTVSRREYSVWGTQWANVFNDPRVPWDTVYAGSQVQNGQDGHTPYFRQMKYPSLASNMPLSSGAEMLLIRAEAALRNSDLASFTTLVNDERAVYGMAPISQPANVASAWPTLEFERGAVLWLEARRLWDLRRWGAQGVNNFLQGRNSCIPIASDEALSNPNLP